ncbi:hypothetical protein Q8F55_007298 [Vanrija albida]|uniref:Major facilitator superfamily (MFS) profile domain-containing protein n=1 Tax=Vanrija albida TaxID=181172 RepID=A0ABR3PZS6_9TREE
MRGGADVKMSDDAAVGAPLARAPSRRTAAQQQHKHLFSFPLPHLWEHGSDLPHELETLLHTVTTLPPHLRHHRDHELYTIENDSLATLGGAPLQRSATITTIGVGPPPDGGREAWLCILAAFLILASVFGFVTSMGQLNAYYLAHQLSRYSKSQVAWIASCQSILNFVPSVLWGRVFDAHGARALVISGTVVCFLALVAVAFSHEYYQFLLAHMLFGIGASLTYSPATSVAPHWFLRHRSTAVGIIVCGAGLGGVVYPIMIKQLTDRLGELIEPLGSSHTVFRDAILIIAGITAALMLPACVWLKTRLPPHKPPPWRDLGKPWHEKEYAFLVLGAAVFTLKWVEPTAWADSSFFTPYFDAPVLAANNLTPTVAAYAVALLQTGSFVGRVLAGVLADSMGVWNLFGSVGFATPVWVLATWIPHVGSAGGIVALLGYGVLSGAWITLVSASAAAISPTREIGLRLGMLWSATGPPILIGPSVSGQLITAAGGKFTYAGVFCGVTLLAGAVLIVVPHAHNWVWGKKRSTIAEGGDTVELGRTAPRISSPLPQLEQVYEETKEEESRRKDFSTRTSASNTLVDIAALNKPEA